MPNIVEITDLSAPELAVYARLTQAQLRNRLEPEKLFSYSNTTCEGMQSAGRIFGAGRMQEYTCMTCKIDMDQAVKIYYNRVRKEGKKVI